MSQKICNDKMIYLDITFTPLEGRWSSNGVNAEVINRDIQRTPIVGVLGRLAGMNKGPKGVVGSSFSIFLPAAELWLYATEKVILS